MVQYCPVSDRPFRRPDAPNDKLCCICLLEYCATPADARKVRMGITVPRCVCAMHTISTPHL